jgi:hypothetical protein
VWQKRHGIGNEYEKPPPHTISASESGPKKLIAGLRTLLEFSAATIYGEDKEEAARVRIAASLEFLQTVVARYGQFLGIGGLEPGGGRPASHRPYS